MVDGEVVVGAMGCPNLLVDPSSPDGERGVSSLPLRVLEQHRYVPRHPMSSLLKPTETTFLLPRNRGLPIMMNKISDLSGASFCEGVEAAHSSHSQQAAIAKALGITKDSVRMDSQAKYSSIARGDGDVYLRLPTSATYQEKIWVCVTYS